MRLGPRGESEDELGGSVVLIAGTKEYTIDAAASEAFNVSQWSVGQMFEDGDCFLLPSEVVGTVGFGEWNG